MHDLVVVYTGHKSILIQHHGCHHDAFCDVQGHDEIVWAVEVSGNRLFSASADKTIRVWDIETRRCIQVLEDHARPVLSLAVSGSYLFSGSYDYSIKVQVLTAMLCRCTCGFPFCASGQCPDNLFGECWGEPPFVALCCRRVWWVEFLSQAYVHVALSVCPPWANAQKRWQTPEMPGECKCHG